MIFKKRASAQEEALHGDSSRSLSVKKKEWLSVGVLQGPAGLYTPMDPAEVLSRLKKDPAEVSSPPGSTFFLFNFF